MTKNINDLILSSDSDDYCHPNIDKKSFSIFRRQQKEKKKLLKRERLDQINHLLQNSENKEKDELIKEKEKLEFDLSEKIVETESNIVINNDSNNADELGIDKDYDHDKYYGHLFYLLENNDLESFIKFIDNNLDLNLKSFEEFVLLNLSENIKSGYDEAGLELSKLSLYFKYALSKGKGFMKKLNEVFKKNDEKRLYFEKECNEHYEKSKELILKMQEDKKN